MLQFEVLHVSQVSFTKNNSKRIRKERGNTGQMAQGCLQTSEWYIVFVLLGDSPASEFYVDVSEHSVPSS